MNGPEQLKNPVIQGTTILERFKATSEELTL